jgi:DNA-binding transcriptional LysR family regulator
MDFRKLKTFQVVADCLNLTKAGDLLGYTQSTVTLQIQSLESEVGVPLIHRIGKKNFLTPSGKIMKQYLDQVFSTLDEMEEELRKLENPRGLLTIAAPEFYCTQYLSLITHSYNSQNPQVQLQLISCDSNEAKKKVTSNEADLAIIAGPCDISFMETFLLGKEDLILVTTKELYEAHGSKDLLENYPFITYKTGSNLQRLVNECMEEYGFKPTNSIECISDETIKRTVLYQTGIALLGSAIVEEELKAGALVEIHRFTGKVETSMIILKNRMDEKNIHSFARLVKGAWPELR